MPSNTIFVELPTMVLLEAELRVGRDSRPDAQALEPVPALSNGKLHEDLPGAVGYREDVAGGRLGAIFDGSAAELVHSLASI